jgi:hypothetical protein
MQQLKLIQRNFSIKLKSVKEVIVSEIKHIIDALGRGQKDGDAKGTHLVQILTYLQSKRREQKNVAFFCTYEAQGLMFGRL